MSVTDSNTTTDDASPEAINTATHTPNVSNAPYSAATTAENNMSVRQLLYGQGYPVAWGGIIKKFFDHEAAVEKCVAFPHVLSQLLCCLRYTGYRITSCDFLKLLSTDKNSMLGAAQFMIGFQGMHFDAKKALYIHFQKHASIFLRKC